jgi:hypothetical protein
VVAGGIDPFRRPGATREAGTYGKYQEQTGHGDNCFMRPITKIDFALSSPTRRLFAAREGDPGVPSNYGSSRITDNILRTPCKPGRLGSLPTPRRRAVPGMTEFGGCWCEVFRGAVHGRGGMASGSRASPKSLS